MGGEDHRVLGAGMGQIAALGVRDGIKDSKARFGEKLAV